MHIPHTLLVVLMVLASAVGVVVIFRRLQLSPVLGYLAAGALIGPAGFGIINDLDAVAHMAEFGVVFLMFVIGLELSFERLAAMRRHVFGLGTLQVFLTAGAIFGVSIVLGVETEAALIIGGGLALSSTALVLQVVQENNGQNTQMGRVSLAILLLQDLIVVPLLVLVPLLGKEDVAISSALGHAALNAVIALVATFVIGRALLRPLFRMVAAAGTTEIFEAFTLLLVLGIATAFQASGLSMAMGAFVAGLLVAETEYKHQVEADILPFKSLLLGLFFMFVGMQLDFELLYHQHWLILGIVVGLMGIKTIITALLCRIFGMKTAKSWHAGLLLSQGGEFGFILFSLAGKEGLFSPQITALLLVAVTCSMALTPLAYLMGKMIARHLARGQAALAPVPSANATFDLSDHVVVFGFGRVGQNIGRLLAAEHVPYIAVEMDANVVTQCRAKGMAVYYGDGANSEIIKSVGLKRANCAVVTADSLSAALRLIAALKYEAPDVPVLARARDLTEVRHLSAAGAELSVSEKHETSLQIGREVLRYSHIAPAEIERMLDLFRVQDYARALGDPNTPSLSPIPPQIDPVPLKPSSKMRSYFRKVRSNLSRSTSPDQGAGI
jgi:CPA2 family monovalent cation:H+ antiporter-2